MTEPTPRFWEVFFEVFERLPRQGPGSRASAARALDLCSGLPSSPAMLDLGCGTGAQTMHLVELTAGSIVAIDSHAPSVELLRIASEERGLADRVQPRVGDMGRPDHGAESFDLIWSEGAVYNIGVDSALRIYHPLVRPGGYFAFTEAVWCKEDPPSEAKAAFADYSAMGRVQDVLAKIDDSDFSLVDHFTLPNEDWWDEFYTPMEHRIEELRTKYTDDADALAALDEVAQEPDMRRRCSDYYAYEFFVVQRG
ncbi:MAG: class I SAM-dependent methyltransferase [Deltaproteobacteria bacterium]|nr:MAG: class I SAM-dependent methyltransferase [Deltaproteobacteria bacterium]